jgi:hypothetical protein
VNFDLSLELIIEFQAGNLMRVGIARAIQNLNLDAAIEEEARMRREQFDEAIRRPIFE